MNSIKVDPAKTALWVSALRDVLEEFADRDIQDRRWFGRNPPEESSPTEVICMLFNNLYIDDALKDPNLDLTPAQRSAGMQFADMVAAFMHDHQDLNEHKVIDDPEWEKIRQVAANLLKILPS